MTEVSPAYMAKELVSDGCALARQVETIATEALTFSRMPAFWSAMLLNGREMY